MPKVEIYYAQMCSLCHKAMDYFKSKGIEFTAYEVFWKNDAWVDDDNSREMIRRCGDVDFVPQLFINDQHIKGWKTLSHLIETGEIDELLKEEYPFMNPYLQFIYQRRSVRKYRKGDVSDKIVKDLLDAGMAAPSAAAKDPWEFIVVRNRNMLAKICEELPNGLMLKDSALGIVVCGDISKAHDRQESYMLQDCSAAIQNILLAVTKLGLGACWLGVHPRQTRMDHIRRVFDLPENIIPVAVLSIGWPDEEHKARTRYNPDLVHYEKW